MFRQIVSRLFGLLMFVLLMWKIPHDDPAIWILVVGAALMIVLLIEKRIESPNIIPFTALVLVVTALCFFILTLNKQAEIPHSETILGILATLAGVAGGQLRHSPTGTPTTPTED